MQCINKLYLFIFETQFNLSSALCPNSPSVLLSNRKVTHSSFSVFQTSRKHFGRPKQTCCLCQNFQIDFRTTCMIYFRTGVATQHYISNNTHLNNLPWAEDFVLVSTSKTGLQKCPDNLQTYWWVCGVVGSNKTVGVRTFHDDVIEWNHFPRYWPFVRGIHRSRWIPHTKASDAELWYFLWSAAE